MNIYENLSNEQKNSITALATIARIADLINEVHALSPGNKTEDIISMVAALADKRRAS